MLVYWCPDCKRNYNLSPHEKDVWIETHQYKHFLEDKEIREKAKEESELHKIRYNIDLKKVRDR